jgi:molybdopterin synthase sulfur carrier subunit
MATVLIPSPLRRLTGGQARVEIEASTVGDLFDRLEAAHPGLRSYLLDESGEIRSYVNVFVNGAEIRQIGGHQAPLAAGDEVAIIPAMAGGEKAAAPAVVGWSRPAHGGRLPELRIVPAEALLLHEECDTARVDRLAQRLEADGMLRNPPVAAALDGQAYVVLDGANRVTALRRLGALHQLAQVVDYGDASVALEVWAHLLRDDGMLVAAQTTPGARWEPMPEEAVRSGLRDGTLACGLVTADGAHGLVGPAALEDRIRLLAGVVAAYNGRTPIHRVHPAALEVLARDYGGAAALVLFPLLTKQEIGAVARLPVKLPSGISRHIIPQRALRVNVDLALLLGDEGTAAKQARLDEIIRGRLLDHRIRHYPEATVLYDE